MTARYSISSGATAGTAAIAIVDLTGDIDAILARLGAAPVGLERVGLRHAPHIDTLVIARVTARHAMLFPHAGPAVIRRLTRALEDAGATPSECVLPSDQTEPDARNAFSARLDHALARAASPLAIDLLLEQPHRWKAAEASGTAAAWLSDEESRTLRRLIDPPLVVAIGPPNVGKSSLLNALAGRTVSVVADEPGTTRDHVGVMLNLAGLVVRFIDAPGLSDSSSDDSRDSSIQAESQKLALDAAAGADLLLRCGDPLGGFREGDLPDKPALRVGLRSDLGPHTRPVDIAISLRPAVGRGGSGAGLEELVRLTRDRLVPPALLTDQRAWRFW